MSRKDEQGSHPVDGKKRPVDLAWVAQKAVDALELGVEPEDRVKLLTLLAKVLPLLPKKSQEATGASGLLGQVRETLPD